MWDADASNVTAPTWLLLPLHKFLQCETHHKAVRRALGLLAAIRPSPASGVQFYSRTPAETGMAGEVTEPCPQVSGLAGRLSGMSLASSAACEKQVTTSNAAQRVSWLPEGSVHGKVPFSDVDIREWDSMWALLVQQMSARQPTVQEQALLVLGAGVAHISRAICGPPWQITGHAGGRQQPETSGKTDAVEQLASCLEIFKTCSSPTRLDSMRAAVVGALRASGLLHVLCYHIPCECSAFAEQAASCPNCGLQAIAVDAWALAIQLMEDEVQEVNEPQPALSKQGQ